jgi:hypothetical protein
MINRKSLGRLVRLDAANAREAAMAAVREKLAARELDAPK